MNGVIAKAVLVLGLVGGIFWGFASMVGQIREDLADTKRQADALVMATDADQAEQRGVELARR
jgi:hypothetical protein